MTIFPYSGNFLHDLLALIMPLFDLTTNVKEVPENFHKETTELVAQLLGKPSTVRICSPIHNYKHDSSGGQLFEWRDQPNFFSTSNKLYSCLS